MLYAYLTLEMDVPVSKQITLKPVQCNQLARP
jgi:hypothetical protein